jgi:hypothetical protein
MSRWGSAIRIGIAAVVSYYSNTWAFLAQQVASEEGRRKRDSTNRRDRREFNAAQKDRLEMVDVVPSMARTLCLGEVRHVEGIRRRWSSGVHDEIATLIISFAGHRINGYLQWYLDDVPVKLDVDGWVQDSSLGSGKGFTTTAAGFAVGATSIPLISGTGTILNGDTVRFNGDGNYYTVATGVSGPGTLVLASPLLKAIGASATAVELVHLPYARPNNAELSAGRTGLGVITLPQLPLAGSVLVVARDFGDGNRGQQVLTEGTHYSVSGNVVTVTSSPHTHSIQVFYRGGAPLKTVRIRPYLGTDTQNVGADLAAEYPGKISSTDRFAGIALAVVDFVFDVDAFPTSFPAVVPAFEGALCYDPRLDSTVPGGSGSHRANNPATWTYTRNPALHARRYATWRSGWDLRSTDLLEADVMRAADVCDLSTAFTLTAPGGGTRTVTLPRYRCGITIPADADHGQSMAAILATMAGRDGWPGGVWRFRAGHMATPVAAIDESWLVMGQENGESDGDAVISAVQALPREQRINRVTGRCVDPSQRYQMLPFPAVEDAVLVAAKGERPVEIDFMGVDHIAHAQHLGSIAIREAAAGTTLELRCGLQAIDLELFDVVTLTHPPSGMVAKTFEVRGWRFERGQPIELRLGEITPDLFTVQSPLTGRDPAPDSTLRRATDVEPIGALTITSGTAALSDTGSLITRTRVEWPPVVGDNVRQGGSVEVQYHDASLPAPAGEWPSWVEPGNSLFATIPGLQAGYVYLFKARAVQPPPTLVRGPWSATVPHLVAAVRGSVIYRQAGAPSTGVQDGDEWYDTDDANLHYVRAGGAWVSVRDGGIAQALADAADAQATADGKIATFYQAGPPTAEGIGDIWFDTDDGFKQYRWNGSTWVIAADTRIGQAINDAADAQATADGKVTTFVAATSPTAEAVGDLWLDSADGNKLYRWSGAAWVALPVGTGAIASNAATEVLSQNTDFAGAGFGTTTADSFSYTPAVASTIEFTANVTAANVNGDAGNSLSWYVTPSGGSPVLLGGSQSDVAARQQFIANNVYLAAAGVALTFELKISRATGNPNVLLYGSYMRATVVKR